MNIEKELEKLESLGFDICTVDGITAEYEINEYIYLITDLVSIDFYYPEENERKFIRLYSFEEIKETLRILGL